MKNRLLVWLLIAGLGIAYIGIKYGNPIVIFLLLGGLGVFGVFSGIQMLLTRRADIPTSSSFDSLKERYTSLAAQLYGILFIVFGIVILLIAVGMWLFPDGLDEGQITRFLDHSFNVGMPLAIVGGLILVSGIIRLIAGNPAYRETKLTPFERVTGGIYFSLLGLGLLAIGVWFIILPSTLKALFESLVSLLYGLLKIR